MQFYAHDYHEKKMLIRPNFVLLNHPTTLARIPANPFSELYLLFCMCITLISHGNNFLWGSSNKRNFCVNVEGTQMRVA